MIMATFTGGLAAAGALGHALRRDPQGQSALDFAVLSLASFKAARTLSRDPVTSFLREPFVEGHARRRRGRGARPHRWHGSGDRRARDLHALRRHLGRRGARRDADRRAAFRAHAHVVARCSRRERLPAGGIHRADDEGQRARAATSHVASAGCDAVARAQRRGGDAEHADRLHRGESDQHGARAEHRQDRSGDEQAERHAETPDRACWRPSPSDGSRGGMRSVQIEWIDGLQMPFAMPLTRIATNSTAAPTSRGSSQSGAAWNGTESAIRRSPSTRCARKRNERKLPASAPAPKAAKSDAGDLGVGVEALDGQHGHRREERLPGRVAGDEQRNPDTQQRLVDEEAQPREDPARLLGLRRGVAGRNEEHARAGTRRRRSPRRRPARSRRP